MRVALWLAATVAAALLALVAAALGAAPALLGALLVVAFVGLAGAAAAAALALDAPDDLTEPRTAHGPTVASPLPLERPTRRVFGKMWLAAAGALAALGTVPLIALARRPGRRSATGWRPGTRLVDETNRPVTVATLARGGFMTVFPENGIALPEASAVLIRLDPALLQPGDGAAAVMGYLTFSKLCTHAGCPVALYRHAAHELYCPCHQSRFDVTRGAKNVSGPAPRPLPRLPLGTDARGNLIALGDFDAPVGPDDWDRRL